MHTQQSQSVLATDLIADAAALVSDCIQSFPDRVRKRVVDSITLGADTEVRVRLRNDGAPCINVWLFDENGKGVEIASQDFEL